MGSVEDGAFLKKAFASADAAYLMIPPNWKLNVGWLEYQKKVTHYYIEAIKANHIRSVVLLSSVGAHLRKGTPWIEFKDADALKGMLGNGLPQTIAEGYVELGVSMREGKMQGEYWKNRPALGKVKLEEFAKQFAQVYNS